MDPTTHIDTGVNTAPVLANTTMSAPPVDFSILGLFMHADVIVKVLESEHPKKEIALYINSPGGVVTSAFAIYDTMQYISSPVSTVCMGFAASAASFLLLTNEVTAAIVNFINGAALMIATIASLTLAADYCPRRSAGFAFAGLMSIMNLADIFSNNIGAFLYEHVFDSRLGPLIVVSAATTALAAVLVPLLRLGREAEESIPA